MLRMKRVLVIAPSWVGDAVMMQPLLMRLLERDPHTQIDVFAPAWCAGLIARMPEVREVIINPFAHGVLAWKARWRVARDLKKRGYQQAIVLPNSLKSALVPWFAGIPQRTGFIGEQRYGLLNDWRRLDRDALPLMVERFVALAEPKGIPVSRPIPQPQLQTDLTQQTLLRARWHLHRQQPLAVFCPGAEFGEAKRWRPRHFAELARQLSVFGWQVVLVGSKKDAPVATEIVTYSGNNAMNLCGKTELCEVVDVLAAADLVVSNDSGLMHVAAALGRPLVALYGSSSPTFTPPLHPQAQVVRLPLTCSPCFARTCPLGHFDCMNKLTPEQVMHVVRMLGVLDSV